MPWVLVCMGSYFCVFVSTLAHIQYMYLRSSTGHYTDTCHSKALFEFNMLFVDNAFVSFQKYITCPTCILFFVPTCIFILSVATRLRMPKLQAGLDRVLGSLPGSSWPNPRGHGSCSPAWGQYTAAMAACCIETMKYDNHYVSAVCFDLPCYYQWLPCSSSSGRFWTSCCECHCVVNSPLTSTVSQSFVLGLKLFSCKRPTRI